MTVPRLARALGGALCVLALGPALAGRTTGAQAPGSGTEGTATLSGTVRDGAGRPVPSFTIELRRDACTPGLERTWAFDDERGRFSIDSLADGAWVVRARGADHLEGPALRIDLVGRDAEVELATYALRTVTGVVVSTSGQPLEGAAVVADVDTSEIGSGSAVPRVAGTGLDGGFTLAGVAPGRVSLRVRRDGYVTDGVELELPATGEATPASVRVELRPGASLRGIVAGLAPTDLVPLSSGLDGSSGASVLLLPKSTGRVARVDVAPDASFAFLDLSADDYDVVLELPGRPDEPAVPVRLNEGEARSLDLRAPPEPLVRVHGTVLCGGQPMPGARVRFRFEGNHRRRETVADEEGRYELHTVPGRRRLVANANGRTLFTELDVPSGVDHRYDVVLPAGTITGRVAYEDGSPATDCSVRADDRFVHPEVRTAHDGTFVLDGLRPGTYELHARDRSPGSSRLTALRVVSTDAADVELTLVEPASLAGLVTHGTSSPLAAGTPAAGAIVEATLMTAGGEKQDSYTAVTDKTDARGRYRLAGLRPGVWTVQTFAEGQASPRTVERAIAGGEEATVDLVLRPATLLGVRLDGTHEHVWAHAVDERGSPLRRRGTLDLAPRPGPETEGFLLLGPVPAGTWHVRAGRMGSDEPLATATVVARGEPFLPVELSTALPARGR